MAHCSKIWILGPLWWSLQICQHFLNTVKGESDLREPGYWWNHRKCEPKVEVSPLLHMCIIRMKDSEGEVHCTEGTVTHISYWLRIIPQHKKKKKYCRWIKWVISAFDHRFGVDTPEWSRCRIFKMSTWNCVHQWLFNTLSTPNEETQAWANN